MVIALVGLFGDLPPQLVHVSQTRGQSIAVVLELLEGHLGSGVEIVVRLAHADHLGELFKDAFGGRSILGAHRELSPFESLSHVHVALGLRPPAASPNPT